MATERETEARNAQEQSSRLQAEVTKLRQELQDKASQVDNLRQQMAEKDEKTKKALVNAKQKISQLTCEFPQGFWLASKCMRVVSLFSKLVLFICLDKI